MNDELTDCERLHLAASSGDVLEVQRLVEAGLDPNCIDTDLGYTPLHEATDGRHLNVIRYLLSVGADPNSLHEPSAGDTPLGHVAQECSYDVAKLLLDAGANPLVPGSMQITPLMRAECRKRPEGRRVYELMLSFARSKFHHGR